MLGNKLGQRIKNISQTIKNFKSDARSIKPSQNAVEILKSLMENVEMVVSNFKEDHRSICDQLANDEKLLTKEIEIYEKKIQNWATSANNDNESQLKTNIIIKDKDSENCELLKEVVDFDVS